MKPVSGNKMKTSTSVSSEPAIDLAHSPELLLRSFEGASEAITWIDQNARFLHANKACCRHFGYSHEELCTMRVFDVDPDFTEEVWDDHWNELKNKGSLHFESLHRHKTGRIFPVEIKLTFLTIGAHGYNLAFLRDISDRKQKEKDLINSESRLSFALQGTQEGMWQIDFIQNTSWVSSRYREILGYADDTVIDYYRDWEKRIHPDDRGHVLERLKAHLEERVPYALEYRIRNMKGEIRWCRARGQAEWDDDGRPVSMSGTLEDITIKKNIEKSLLDNNVELDQKIREHTAELNRVNKELRSKITEMKAKSQALQESENRFRAIATSTADLLWEGDVRTGDLVWFGDIDTALGYDLGKFPRTIEGHFAAIHEEDRKPLGDKISKAIESGSLFSADYRIQCRDGSYRYWNERGRPIVFEDGKAVKWAGSVTDITEKKNDEIQIRESEKRYKDLYLEFEALLSAIPDYLLLLSPDLKILWANKAFSEGTGRSVMDLQGHHCYAECCGTSRPCSNCPVKVCFKTGKEASMRVMNAEGKIFDKRAFPVQDEKGKLVSVIEVGRDITAKVHMEEEAKLVQSRLMHANKMTSLGTLVAGVAHEINNPNSYVLNNAQVIEDIWSDALALLSKQYRTDRELALAGIPFGELKKVMPKMLKGITDGSMRIKGIVDNLKNFSRPEQPVLENRFNVNTIIMTAASILESQSRKMTDVFRVRINDALPLVRGNAQQIEQVVVNLIMNALQSLPGKQAGVVVSVSLNKKTGMVEIKIKDEGVGIPADILENVTDPFFTTRSDRGGMGLGLSISFSIVNAHGGHLVIKSKEGKGTTATVKLPTDKDG